MSDRVEERWAQVALPVPLRHALTYAVPPAWRDRLGPGQRVLVQLGPRKMTGVVLSVADAAGPPPGGKTLRPLLDVLDQKPLLNEELLGFVLRAAEYYLCPPGEAVRAALPPGMSGAERGGRMPRVLAEPPTVLCTRLVLPAPGDPHEALRRAPARARLLARLPADGSEVLVSDLRRFHTQATQLLRALAANGWVELVRRPPPQDPLLLPAHGEPDISPTLTDEQRAVLNAIEGRLDSGQWRGILLHGVTGSGKTEIYLRAIARVLEAGGTALVLVPEIALTPQLVSRFRARLGALIGVLHSGLTPAQRRREWARLQAGEARVAIGARSAVFAPLKDLKIIVVDEEHDPSFKQDDGFRYNGRDLALLRAQRLGAVAVLGSATPSLESYHSAQEGRFELLVLPHRVTPQPLPEVEVVDLRRHRSGPTGQSVITSPLLNVLASVLEQGDQSILFINRRGYAPVAACESCGEALRCKDCSVTLTYHHRAGVLECHYCSHAEPLPKECPTCGAHEVHLLGAGTERVEQLLAELLRKDVRVARLDSDIAPGRGSESVLDRVRAGQVDILVGTQMVTKGHDLPNVRVVGVLLADSTLHFPDFRAGERTFQLLTQVAGRAGRGEREGEVVIQTFMPDHPIVRLASHHDYVGFYEYEMESRRELGYPPVARLATIRLSSTEEGRVQHAADTLVAIANRLPEVQRGLVQVAGPAPAPIAMIRKRFRYRILLKAAERLPLRRVLARLIEPVDKTPRGVRAAFDVDPVHLL